MSGDFYAERVTSRECIHCLLPQLEAPGLIAYVACEGGEGQCYFKCQPQSPGELAQAIAAVEIACCEALRYGGADPAIIAELRGYNCDHA